MNNIHTFVKQQHKYGCGIACVAMATNKNYVDILKLIPNHNFNKEGITPEALCSVLAELKCKTELRYRTVLHSQKRRNKFTGDDAFYIGVSNIQIFQIDNHSVFVSHGFIYDPNSKDMSCTGFQHINEMFNIDEEITDHVVSVINVFCDK